MTTTGHAEHLVATSSAPALFPSVRKADREHCSAAPSAQILVLSDDRSMRSFLRREFLDLNLRVEVSGSVEEALELLASQTFDLVLVDLNGKETNAQECLTRIRGSRAPFVPILMLTVRTGVDDAIVALDNGADDCIVKPFSLQEMQARVRCLLRRSIAAVAPFPTKAGLQLRADQNVVLRGSRRVQLTAREYALLEYLLANYGNTVSRADLLRNVWQTADDPRTNLVDVYMKYLRDKLDGEGEVKLIRTVRGIGYVLSAE